ncbi:MAG: hypothetical protein IJU00_08890, partial [Selenomonas sp.]|nr:hypothetical protein [Selenomonas sp.]
IESLKALVCFFNGAVSFHIGLLFWESILVSYPMGTIFATGKCSDKIFQNYSIWKLFVVFFREAVNCYFKSRG